MSLTPAAKKIWDNTMTKREVKPTFGDFRTYLENRLDQLAPSNQSNLNPLSFSASFTFSPSPVCQRHHTLLHKDPLEPTAASFSLAVDKEETEVPKDDANISPTFSNTIIVSISNRGKTMKVRAILDSGADVSLMSSSLATYLGLKRIPHSLSSTGSLGSGRSTYSVKTSLHSDDSFFALTPITFSVLPKLNLLLFQSTRSLSLTYPQSETFTAVYLRRIHADNSTHCTLLSAKSRVMLLKALTIPKAELQAALLLTKLLTYLVSQIQVPI